MRWPGPSRWCVMGIVAITLYSPLAQAQVIALAPALRPGEDLKLFPRDSVLARALAFQTATFFGIRSDTIVAIRWRPASDGVAAGPDTLALALSALDSVLVQRRTEGRARRDAAGEGLILGSFVGAVYGVVIGGIVAMVSKDVDTKEGTGKGALIGTGIGAVALAGMSLFQDPPSDYGVRWERVRWEIPASPPPLPHGGR